MGKKGKKNIKKKGKKKPRNKPTSKKYSKYKIEGSGADAKATKQARNCPKCGPGVFLSQSKDRLYCGKCHYTEFLKKE